MEKWDVYDCYKNKIKSRGTIHSTDELREGEYNLVTATWICNSKGEFLMQRRAADKMYPLVYANHGGRAHAGETSKESMIRELKEEIGVIIGEDELSFLRSFNDHESIFDEYIIYKDISLCDITIDKREVESCAWLSLQEISDMIDNGKCFNYKNNNLSGESSFSIITKLVTSE